MFGAAMEAEETTSIPDLLASGARRFGDYELLGEIARGGMGVVFKARQISLNRTVAVKMILRGEFASVAELARFRAEAETAARLQHPSIVAIHEVGEHEGRPFFSMDFVEGQSLAQLVGNTPLPAMRAAKYLKTVAEAVQYAHQQGVLHRDLKPSNVLIDAASDQPRVTDFGLAKRQEGDASLTVTGQVLGSPNFMPPEQAAGKQEAIGTASDVYSLGAMLYHLLTGRPPFVADSLTATLRLVAESEPIAPRLLAPQVPQDLETVCLKCLDKDPRRRYVRAQELAEELDRFLRDEPIRARPIGPWEKFHRWTHRHPVVTALTAIIGVLLIAVAVISTVAAGRLRKANYEGQEKLRLAYLSQARANRWSGQPGRRFDSLEALRQAAEIRPSIELRNEAIACLTLPDIRPLRRWPAGLEDMFVFDEMLETFAHGRNVDGHFEVSLRRASDDQELARVRQPGSIVALRLSCRKRWLELWSKSAGRPVFALHDTERHETFALPVSFDADVSPQEDSIALGVTLESGKPGLRLTALPSRLETLSIPLPGEPMQIAFSRDGTKVAIAYDDPLGIELREAQTGKLYQTLPIRFLVRDLDWSADRTTLAAAGGDGGVYLWDVQAATPIARRLDHGKVAVRVRFNQQGSLLASIGWNNRLRIWDPRAGRELLNLPAIGYRLDAFGANDDRLAWWETQEQVQLCEVADGRELDLIRFPDSKKLAEWHSHFGPDGRVGVFASQAGEGLRVRDMKSGELAASLPVGTVWSVAIARSNEFLLAVCDRQLKRWPLRVDASGVAVGQGETLNPKDLHDANGAWLSTEGTQAYVDANQWMHLVDVTSGRILRRFPLGFGGYFTDASPDGRWYATSSIEKGIKGSRVWDTAKGLPVRQLPATTLQKLAFTPDARLLLAGSSQEYVAWNTHTWDRAYVIERRESGGAHALIAVSRDGSLGAVTVKADSIQLFDPSTGRNLATLESLMLGPVHHLALSPEARWLLATTEEGIRVWDLGRIRHQLAAMNLDWESSSAPGPPSASQSLAPTGLAVVPARDPRCSPRLIDLSPHYNASFSEFSFFSNMPENDLSPVPVGIQTLVGTPFDVRGVVLLAGNDPVPSIPAPNEVRGIRVDQPCRSLSFLHSSMFASIHGGSGVSIADYVIHYQDGRQHTIPVVVQDNIADWWAAPSQPYRLGTNTVAAWHAPNNASGGHGCDVYLYRFRWTNPRPEAPIATIDFRSTRGGVAPFLVAITAE